MKDYNSLGYIKSDLVLISFNEIKEDFDDLFQNKLTKKSDIINVLKKYVIDFSHIEKGKHLDQKM